MIRSKFAPVEYTGAPGEQVSISTQATNNSENLRVVFTLDGAHAGKGPNSTFFFSNTPGARRVFSVSFFGAVGETCGVGVSNVTPVGTDKHALVVTNSVPVPTDIYEFITAGPGPIAAKAVAKKAASKKATKKAAKNAAKKNH